jgi:hypothetical protein
VAAKYILSGSGSDCASLATAIFARPDGITDECVPGDPGYWDPNDPRPWVKHYAIGERRWSK